MILNPVIVGGGEAGLETVTITNNMNASINIPAVYNGKVYSYTLPQGKTSSMVKGGLIHFWVTTGDYIQFNPESAGEYSEAIPGFVSTSFCRVNESCEITGTSGGGGSN